MEIQQYEKNYSYSLFIRFFLLISCENNVSQNTVIEEAIKTVNVLYNENGDAILIENSEFFYAPYMENVSTGEREAGKGFMVGCTLTKKEVRLSVEEDAVSENTQGSIKADSYASEAESQVYYVFTYEGTPYLIPSYDSCLCTDYEAKVLSLNWEDVSNEELVIENSQCGASSIYYAEDEARSPYYKVAGLILQ